MTLAQGQNWVKPQLCREAGQSLPARPSHYEVLKETSFLKVSTSQEAGLPTIMISATHAKLKYKHLQLLVTFFPPLDTAFDIDILRK